MVQGPLRQMAIVGRGLAQGCDEASDGGAGRLSTISQFIGDPSPCVVVHRCNSVTMIDLNSCDKR